MLLLLAPRSHFSSGLGVTSDVPVLSAVAHLSRLIHSQTNVCLSMRRHYVLYCEILGLVLAKYGRFMLQQSLKMVQIDTCVSVSALMTVL